MAGQALCRGAPARPFGYGLPYRGCVLIAATGRQAGKGSHARKARWPRGCLAPRRWTPPCSLPGSAVAISCRGEKGERKAVRIRSAASGACCIDDAGHDRPLVACAARRPRLPDGKRRAGVHPGPSGCMASVRKRGPHNPNGSLCQDECAGWCAFLCAKRGLFARRRGDAEKKGSRLRRGFTQRRQGAKGCTGERRRSVIAMSEPAASEDRPGCAGKRLRTKARRSTSAASPRGAAPWRLCAFA